MAQKGPARSGTWCSPQTHTHTQHLVRGPRRERGRKASRHTIGSRGGAKRTRKKAKKEVAPMQPRRAPKPLTRLRTRLPATLAGCVSRLLDARHLSHPSEAAGSLHGYVNRSIAISLPAPSHSSVWGLVLTTGRKKKKSRACRHRTHVWLCVGQPGGGPSSLLFLASSLIFCSPTARRPGEAHIRPDGRRPRRKARWDREWSLGAFGNR